LIWSGFLSRDQCSFISIELKINKIDAGIWRVVPARWRATKCCRIFLLHGSVAYVRSKRAATEERIPSGPSGQIVVRLRLIGQMEAWTVTSDNILPADAKRVPTGGNSFVGPPAALRGRLAELLWSRRPEEQARLRYGRKSIVCWKYSRPRKPRFYSHPRSFVVAARVVWVDVEEVKRATTSNSVTVFVGRELLEDLTGIDPTFDMWLTTERERLRDRARGVAESLLRDQIGPDATIPAAQRLLQIDRAHEGAWRALIAGARRTRRARHGDPGL